MILVSCAYFTSYISHLPDKSNYIKMRSSNLKIYCSWHLKKGSAAQLHAVRLPVCNAELVMHCFLGNNQYTDDTINELNHHKRAK